MQVLFQYSSKNKSTQTTFISFLNMQKSPELTSKHLPGSVTVYCRMGCYLKNFQVSPYGAKCGELHA